MEKHPDTYPLYEYSKKISYTARIKVTLSERIEEAMLIWAAQEAIARFPYFSVRVELDEGGSYVLKHNDRPIPVLPEKNARLVLGSEAVSGHLFAITWRADTVWFNFAHSVCGGTGAMSWVKTTLYQYLTRRYGPILPPADLKAVDSPVSEEELAYPDVETLPEDKPTVSNAVEDCMVGFDAYLKYFLNPFARRNYYYQIEIPSGAFMSCAKEIGASPASLLTAMMLKTAARCFPLKKGQEKKKGWHLSATVSYDFRSDIGCEQSYRDFVRPIHVKFDWEMAKESLAQMSKRTREEIRLQTQKALSCACIRKRASAHEGIDAQPDLKSKQKYATQHSSFRNEGRDTYTISYLGLREWGGMADYIRSVNSIADGNLLLEANALPDKFCLTFHMLGRDRKAPDLFCKVLEETGLPYTISERMTRYLPELRLPVRM